MRYSPLITNTILILCILALICPIFLYFNTFSGEISSSHRRWGEFGSIWGGFVGTIISGIALGLVILSNIKNYKIIEIQKDKELITRLLEIYYKQIDRLNTTKLHNEVSFSFHYMNDFYKIKYKLLFDIYLYNCFVKTDILDWPKSALTFFAMNNKHIQSFSPHFDNIDEYYSPDSNEIQSIKHIWDSNSESQKLEHLKGIYSRPIKERESALNVFFDFINKQHHQFYCQFYSNVFEALYEEFGYSFNNYLKNHLYIMQSIDMSLKSNEHAEYYLNQLSNDELEMLFYYTVSCRCPVNLRKLHFQYSIWDSLDVNSFYGYYDEERAMTFVKQFKC